MAKIFFARFDTAKDQFGGVTCKDLATEITDLKAKIATATANKEDSIELTKQCADKEALFTARTRALWQAILETWTAYDKTADASAPVADVERFAKAMMPTAEDRGIVDPRYADMPTKVAENIAANIAAYTTTSTFDLYAADLIAETPVVAISIKQYSATAQEVVTSSATQDLLESTNANVVWQSDRGDIIVKRVEVQGTRDGEEYFSCTSYGCATSFAIID